VDRSQAPAKATTCSRSPLFRWFFICVRPRSLKVMDKTCRVALYARVSSQRQAEEATIQSQVAALEQRIAADGFRLDVERRFLDDGCSGSTLQRPALERLRDLSHLGGVERLYLLSPDRLARQFVHQLVLMEEFAKERVQVIFLNQPSSEVSPESNLLLQMQGMFAEYERAKILERTRRGRRFRARQGEVSALGHAPYGYRYVSKRDGDGQARYDVVLDEARVVRDLFRWVGLEGLSTTTAARRLTAQKIPTLTGQRHWHRSTVLGILLKTAYYGDAHWGKTRLETRANDYRPRRGEPEVPRRDKVARPTAPSEQESIPVPALISRDLFDVVAERLEENRRRQRAREANSPYLLSGLLVCGCCESAYCGRTYHRRGRSSVDYRCLGTDTYRQHGEKICANAALKAPVEEQVWNDVCDLLQNPTRVREELERRHQAAASAKTDSSLRKSISGLKAQLARLLDMYQAGYLKKSEFEERAQRVKDRLSRDERAYAEQQHAEEQAKQCETLLAQFEQFADQVKASVNNADLATKQKILKLLIKRIEVGVDKIQIVYKVQSRPFAQGPASSGRLHHCTRSLRSGAL